MARAARTSIRDVAREAGVAVSTVSLVMNGRENVAEATRERVLHAAERLGYQPSRQARNLVRRDTGNVGFVLREDHFTRSEPFYTRIFLGTEFEARRRNTYVLLTTIPDVYDPVLHEPRFLREHNVDGVVVAGKVDTAFLDAVQTLDLPCVLVDYAMPGFPSVVIDDEGAGRAVARHLIGRDHTHIGFVGADVTHPSIAARLAGFRDELARAGLALAEGDLFVHPGAPTRATGTALGTALLGQPDHPTAVFCANDALALGLMDAASHAGIFIPDELSVVGFDDVEGAASAFPPLTTVRVFKEYLGEAALVQLAELIAARGEARSRYARAPSTLRVETELVVRETT